MNRFVRYLLYTILLLFTETIVCICLFEAELLFSKFNIDAWHIHKAFTNSLEVNAVRFIFYFVFSMTAFYILMNLFKWRNRTLQASIYNSTIYIGISLFYALLLPGAFEYLSSDFFYFLIVATLSSPFILGVLGGTKFIG
jgi:hypothetical protein